MAFWNRKKNDNDDKELKDQNASGGAFDNDSDDMSDAMRAIDEALAEEQTEKEEKAKARAEESERILKEQEELRARAQKTASEYINESSADEKGDGRKFYLMVEGPSDYAPKNEKNILVEGNCYGSISKGDEVFCYRNNNSIVTMKVEDIRTGPNLFAESAEDKHVVIELSGDHAEDLERFSVITNSIPDQLEDKHRQITNPRVLGLSFEFNLYAKDQEFFSALVDAIVHGEYVTHAKLDKTSVNNGKGKMGIMSIRDDSTPDGLLIPVFTDVFVMSRAKTNFKQDEVTVLPLTFPQLAEFATTQNHTGFVINPFGPVSIKIPKVLIDDVRKMESYQKEFSGAKTDVTVETDRIPNNVKIAIGIPPENAEYKAIRSAVAKYCQTDASISKAGICMKMDPRKKSVTYLCIVDCPKGKEKECFTKIFIAVKPFLNKHQMDFMRYEEAKFADDYFTHQKLIYQKV